MISLIQRQADIPRAWCLTLFLLFFPLTATALTASSAYPVTPLVNGPLSAADGISQAGAYADGTYRLKGDDQSKAYRLPWPFPFYGQQYNEIGVDSNGSLWLGAPHRKQAHLNLPYEGPVISPWSNDLDSSVNGLGVTVQHKTHPERVVFQWSTATYCNSQDINTFETVLYPNGFIIVRYLGFGNVSNDEGSGISSGLPGESVNLSTLMAPVFNLAGTAFLFEADLNRVALLSDQDSDGLDDASELLLGSSPTIADSDGDGVKDGWQYYLEGRAPGSAQPVIHASMADIEVIEGNVGYPSVTMKLRLDATPTRPVRFYYRTVDGSARSGQDFLFSSGVIDIPAGATSGNVLVRLLSDRLPEGLESFKVAISTNSSRIQLATPAEAVITIRDDDPDADNDLVTDSLDNCTLVANADQADNDGDGFGNRCDTDLNNDGLTDFGDLLIFGQYLGQVGPLTDFNADGLTDFGDLMIFFQHLGQPAGPSGLRP